MLLLLLLQLQQLVGRGLAALDDGAQYMRRRRRFPHAQARKDGHTDTRIVYCAQDRHLAVLVDGAVCEVAVHTHTRRIDTLLFLLTA